MMPLPIARAKIEKSPLNAAPSIFVVANARFSRRSERSEPRSAATGSSADASTDFRPDDPRQIFLAGTSGIPVCRRKTSTAPAVGLVRRGRNHSSGSEGAHAVAADEAGSPASPDDDLNVFSSLSAQVRTQRADLHPRIATSSQGTPPRVREEPGVPGVHSAAERADAPKGRGRFRSVARLAARASRRAPTRDSWPPPAPLRGSPRGCGQ